MIPGRALLTQPITVVVSRRPPPTPRRPPALTARPRLFLVCLACEVLTPRGCTATEQSDCLATHSPRPQPNPITANSEVPAAPSEPGLRDHPRACPWTRGSPRRSSRKPSQRTRPRSHPNPTTARTRTAPAPCSAHRTAPPHCRPAPSALRSLLLDVPPRSPRPPSLDAPLCLPAFCRQP